jgi:hypothetical protein
LAKARFRQPSRIIHFALLRSCFGAPSWRAQVVFQQPARPAPTGCHGPRPGRTQRPPRGIVNHSAYITKAGRTPPETAGPGPRPAPGRALPACRRGCGHGVSGIQYPGITYPGCTTARTGRRETASATNLAQESQKSPASRCCNAACGVYWRSRASGPGPGGRAASRARGFRERGPEETDHTRRLS